MLRLALACSAGLFLALPAFAQDTSPAPDSASALELKSLRETVELQSQQLEKISQQLDDVLHRLGMKGVLPAPPKMPAPAPAEATPAPKAVAVDGQKTHVVQKGETLTAIAHQYGVTVTELQNANHITDGRRLQIEQNLIIPAAKSDPSATPSPQPSAP